MMNKRLIFLILSVVLLLIGATAVYWTWFVRAGQYVASGLVQAKELKNASRLGGRIAAIKVSEGQHVKVGDLLLQFDDWELQSQLRQAEAALIQATIRYEQLKQGADKNDIHQAQAQVQEASENYHLVNEGARPEELTQAKAQWIEAKSQLKVLQMQLLQTQEQVREGVQAPAKLQQIKNQILVAQSRVLAANAAVQLLREGAKPEQRQIAKSHLTSAQAQLNKLTEGAKPGDLKVAAANVAQAKSALEAVKNQTKELNLRAPIAGVVSVIGVSPGELVQPGKPVISLVDDQQLWTDVYIPEKYLARIQLDQGVNITSETYPGTVFQGKVSFVSPKSEFIPSAGGGNDAIEGASFRVKISIRLDHKGPRLFPGMKVKVIL